MGNFLPMKLVVPVALAASLSVWTSAAIAQDRSGEEIPREKQDKDSPFSAEFSVGLEYDSNINVDEIDNNTGSNDKAAAINADLEYDLDLSSDTVLSLGYNFSQTLHDDFTNFDLQTHFVSADLSHDFGDVEPGIAYRFIHSRLGGDGFLTMHQISPYVSAFLSEKLFARADYTYSDKNFLGRADRDAENHAGGVDFYYFVDGVKTYFVAGYKYANENAVDPQFDYDAHQFKLRFSQRFPVGSRDAELKLGWRYEARNYDNITPAIGVARDDDRHRLQAELEVPITDVFFARAEYEYGDYSSNLPTADYSQHLLGVHLGAKF
jgi:Surface lipoprotein assembly modifier